MSSSLIGTLCVLAVAAVVAPVIIWKYKTRVWIWTPLSLPEFAVRYVLPRNVTEAQLARALKLASEQLYSIWPRSAVNDAMNGVSVFVVGGAKWQSAQGVWVGGEQDGPVLKVEQGLSSLFHEAAHWVEEHHEGTVDYEHAKWATKGIFTADEAYRSALKG
jgi:hypothetical protein